MSGANILVQCLLDHGIDILVKKFERTDAQCEQCQAFQEFEGGDETQATGIVSSLSHFSRPRLYIKKQARLCCVRPNEDVSFRHG